MTVFELIQQLVNYSADTEVYAEVGSSDVKFDIDNVDSEFHMPVRPERNRAVIVLSAW